MKSIRNILGIDADTEITDSFIPNATPSFQFKSHAETIAELQEISRFVEGFVYHVASFEDIENEDQENHY